MNIPFHLILTLFITAKMKIKTSVTDVPYAITDAETLSEIGWNIWDNERDLDEGLMDEGILRNILKKYSVEEIVKAYNTYVQEHVFPRMDIVPDIHILDSDRFDRLFVLSAVQKARKKGLNIQGNPYLWLLRII